MRKRALVVLVATLGLIVATPTPAGATLPPGKAHPAAKKKCKKKHGKKHRKKKGAKKRCKKRKPPEKVIGRYAVRNLVSDIPGGAELLDPALINPWGLALNPTGGA